MHFSCPGVWFVRSVVEGLSTAGGQIC